MWVLAKALFCTASVLLLASAAASEDPAPAPNEHSRKDILGTEKKLYSQNNEELIIRDFFQDRKGGFFLDVGSSHPEEHSTTNYLEKHLGWTGIAIDALPEYAPMYLEQRPSTRFFNYIVTDHQGTQDKFYRVPKAPGISSTIKGREFRGHVLEAETILVPTITLNALLDREGIEKIDFVSMDIERGAPKALAEFDLERFAPSLICIEAGSGKEYRRVLKDYFDANGYHRIDKYRKHQRGNWYYTPNR